jgi:class 3 adenylate cyclase
VFGVVNNPGPVLAGVGGPHGHRVHGVFGDTVNTGARLQGKAPVGGVLVGEATHARLPQTVSADLVELEVKGKTGTISAYVVRAV